MRLFIYVEGQEEELFVNRVLRDHLRLSGVLVQRPILAATSFRIGSDARIVSMGGVTNYAAIRTDILDWFATAQVHGNDALTTLIDLYALPQDFPGCREAVAKRLTGGAKADYIEHAWQNDIGSPRFFPYIQVHEFEALILTRPSILTDFYPERAANIETLSAECAPFRTPEDINDQKTTSPSHRILHHIPMYRKIDGFRHLQSIGVSELKAHCPRFKSWLERMEKLQ
jgi:hypothetical protein